MAVETNNRTQLPIADALKRWEALNNDRFCMPGHKGNGPLEGWLTPALDVTELSVLDDLHHPEGVVLDSEERVSRIFGAGRTLSLVNGASSGLKAVIMAHGRRGPVVIPRNGHRAVLEGLILSGGQPEYVFPEEYDGMMVPAAPQAYEGRGKDHLLVMLAESYEGFVRDYSGLETGSRILADEAHGGHLRFLGCPSALDWADYTVHGAHKTLGSLTQSGFLHLCRSQETATIRRQLSLLVSTSPSWLMLASLEEAAGWWEAFSDQEKWIQRSARLKERIDDLPGMRAVFDVGGSLSCDPFRLCVRLEQQADGCILGQELRNHYGIELEMHSREVLVAILTPFDSADSWERLYQGLRELSCRYGLKDSFPQHTAGQLPLPQQCMTPQQAHGAPAIRLDVGKAEGRISADIVAAYPPGIPLLYPGEEIGRDQVWMLRELLRSGSRIQGMVDEQILVVDESC